MIKIPLVSVIILNYNGGKVAEKCLLSVLDSSYKNLEIVFIDNCSAQKEFAYFKEKYFRKVKFIRSCSNLGFASGNNLGAENANGEFLVFLNNDTIVPPHWLEKPIEILRKNTNIAFIQPKILWLRNKKYFEYAGGAGGFIDYFGFPFARGRIFGTLEEDIGQYNDEKEIFWASGVAMFTRKTTFISLEGFDTEMFMHAEEEDLCFRALRRGLRILYTPSSYVFHIGAYTGGKDMFKRTFYNFRNHLIMLTKNLKMIDLIIILPVKTFFDLGAIIYYLFLLKSRKNAFAVVVAYGSFLFHLPGILRKRNNKIGPFGYPNNHNLVYRNSIVIQHFLLGKKRWGDIFGIGSPSKTTKIY